MRAGIALVLLGVLGWVAACSDDPSGPCSTCPPPPPQGLIVSNPIPAPGLAAGAAPAHASSAPSTGAGDNVTYVSLTPGTAPTGSRATVRRVGDVATLTTAVFDGGFDPVAIAAQAGDSIEVTVTDAGGTTIFAARMAVGAHRPPVIVRTNPPPKKRDVPLNASLLIVFSEPVDGKTLNTSSVQVLRGSSPVAGTVSLLGGTATSAVLTPAALLDPNSDYQLVVTPAVRDLDGDSLEAGTTVDFTTGAVTAGPVASVTVSPDSVTLDVQASIQLAATLRDAQGALRSGVPIAWTSDNTTAATVNASGLVTGVSGGVARVIAASGGVSDTATITVQGIAGRIAFVSSRDGNAEIYAMNADGSGLVRLTTNPAADQSPAWSPDGSKLAFASDRDGPLNIYAMNADGTGIVRLTVDPASDLHPAWSPDGRRIAFESTRDDGINAQIYVMNADGTGVVRLAYDTATVTDTTGTVLHTYADQSPTWSPDGSSLAFIGYHGSYKIYTIRADGAGMSRLTTGLDAVYRYGRSPYTPPDGSRLAWSPDGSRFVVANVGVNSAGLTSGGIALVNADGTGAHWIYNNVFVNAFGTCRWVNAGSPGWSPDAARIVFALWVADGCATGERGRPPYASTRTSIQVMNVDGTGVHTLTTSINRNNDEPSWKP